VFPVANVTGDDNSVEIRISERRRHPTKSNDTKAKLLQVHQNECEFGRLGTMPERSVFLEFIRRPDEAAEIENAAADNDPCSAVVAADDEGAQRNGHGSDERIEEKYFLLVCSQIIRLSKDNDIHDHVNQQNPERSGRKQALGKPKVLQINIYASEPCDQSASDCYNKGLPESLRER